MTQIRPIKNWIAALIFFAGTAAAQEPRELSWNDLLPKSQSVGSALPEPAPQTRLDRLLAEVEANQSVDVPVVKELNGANVKIPGFVVPLEFVEGGTVGSLLLVPYFGACMHYPPPPANQVVHVELATPMVIDSLWEPVWVLGEMTTTFRNSEMGAAGYSMAAGQIQAYD